MYRIAILLALIGAAAKNNPPDDQVWRAFKEALIRYDEGIDKSETGQRNEGFAAFFAKEVKFVRRFRVGKKEHVWSFTVTHKEMTEVFRTGNEIPEAYFYVYLDTLQKLAQADALKRVSSTPIWREQSKSRKRLLAEVHFTKEGKRWYVSKIVCDLG